MGKQLAVTVNAVHRVGSKMYLTTSGVYRKAKKAYLTDGGVHKLCYEEGSAIDTMTISCTGTMIDAGIVSMTDGEYRLLTLTTSGTLTVDADVTAEVWMCGGGANGEAGGSGGAGAYTATGLLTLSGGTVAVVGSAGGLSSFGGVTTKVAQGVSGGTGGGRGNYSSNPFAGSGDGVSKYPFLDSEYFKNPHCAGGGGGARNLHDTDNNEFYSYSGGSGGTNGGNGYDSYYTGSYDVCYGGGGGKYGGGGGGLAYYYDDGRPRTSDGTDATFYGSGGGGGGYSENFEVCQIGQGGKGYQGVIYIRIPVNQ